MQRESFTIKLTQVTGGAAINASSDSVSVVIVDDGDVSPPGQPRKPALVRTTGGVLELSLDSVDPSNAGGAAEVIVGRTPYLLGPGGVLVSVSTTVRGLRALTTYQFVAIVENSQFRSLPSAVLVATTTRPTPPSAPLGVNVFGRTGGLLLLTWTEPVDTGGVDLNGYVVHVYKTDDDLNLDAASEEVQRNSEDPTGAGLAVARHHGTSLLAGSAYAFLVAAENEAGVGEFSALAVHSTDSQLSLPSAPTVTLTSASSGFVDLVIKPPLDLGGAANVEYDVYVRITTTATYVPVSREDGSMVRVSNLRAESPYTFMVQAVNAGGDQCLQGVTASVATGSAELELRVGTDAGDLSAEAVLHKLTVNPLGSAVRVGIGTYAPVLVLGGVSAASIEAGSVPLSTVYSGLAQEDQQLCLCGSPSVEVATVTGVPTLPGATLPPVLLVATGGALSLRMTGPGDSGGVPVVNFVLVLQPASKPALLAHLEVSL